MKNFLKTIVKEVLIQLWDEVVKPHVERILKEQLAVAVNKIIQDSTKKFSNVDGLVKDLPGKIYQDSKAEMDKLADKLVIKVTNAVKVPSVTDMLKPKKTRRSKTETQVTEESQTKGTETKGTETK